MDQLFLKAALPRSYVELLDRSLLVWDNPSFEQLYNIVHDGHDRALLALRWCRATCYFCSMISLWLALLGEITNPFCGLKAKEVLY